MNSILIFLILTLLSSCGSRYKRKEYPWRPYKNQQFIGHNGNGFGVLKDHDTLFFGKFSNGYKEGLFKVVYPNSDYAYRFYKKYNSHYDATQVGSYAVIDGTPIATYPISDFSDKTLVLEEETQEIEIFNFPKTKDSKKNVEILSISADAINHYANEKSDLFYTRAGQILRAYYPDGAWFRGDYQDVFGLKLHQRFELTDYQKDTLHIQTLKNKEFQIEISKIKNTDSVYQGETRNGVPHGFGALVRSDEVIIGFFEDGKVNGSATLIDKTGRVYYGFYQDGKKNGAFVFAFQTVKAKLTLPPSNLEYIKTLDQQFSPLVEWYNGDRTKSPPRLSLPFEDEFKKERGQLKIQYISKTNEQKFKNPLNLFGLGASAFVNDWTRYTSDIFEHYYEVLFRAPFGKTLSYSIYKEDQLIKNGFVNLENAYKCRTKVRGLRTYVYPSDCQNPEFYFSNAYHLIQHPRLEDGEIKDGYSAHYLFTHAFGHHGKFVDGRPEGEGINFSQKLRGFYKNGFLNGRGLYFFKDKVASGVYVNGKREGKFWKTGTQFGEYESGLFKDDREEGEFKLTNISRDLSGSAFYKAGKLNGEKIRRWNKNQEIYFQLTYIEGKEEGKGICTNNNISEPCEFKNGKRIDQTYLDRQAKRQAQIAAAQKAEQEKREEENRRRRIEEQERRAEARKRKLRQRQNTLLLMQSYQNQINSIKNTVPAPNYNFQKKNYAPKSKSAFTLTQAKKPYKQCILEENHKGNRIQVPYDCNDKEGTYPKALKVMADNKAWYDEEDRKRNEARQRNEQAQAERRSKMITFCEEFKSKTGSYCHISCDSKVFDLSNCRALSK